MLAAQMVKSRAIPVLCWHKISPRLDAGLTRVSPQRFKEQLRTVKECGYRAISGIEFVERRGLQVADEKLCLFSFDDAYECVDEFAAELMAEFDFPGVLFPILDYIGKENSWDPGRFGRVFHHMGEAAICRLLSNGWEIGLHGKTHQSLSNRRLDFLDQEIVRSRIELQEKFNRDVVLLAWPFGQSDRRAERIAAACGIRIAFANGDGSNKFRTSRSMVYPYHGAKQIEFMLNQGSPDFIQRMAMFGAYISSVTGRKNS
jgi:peptidoglycan/xylan/chitin deacetylase (PgdA/CDA1 family)